MKFLLGIWFSLLLTFAITAPLQYTAPCVGLSYCPNSTYPHAAGTAPGFRPANTSTYIISPNHGQNTSSPSFGASFAPGKPCNSTYSCNGLVSRNG